MSLLLEWWNRALRMLSITLTVFITAGLVAALLSWGIAELPAGDSFIYPLRRFAYATGDALHIPVGLILALAIITLWPLMIQWGIARAKAFEIEKPRLGRMFLLIAVGTLAFGLFRTVEPPREAGRGTNAAHTYIFNVRDLALQPTEFFLYECDRQGTICRPVLPPDAPTPAWNPRLRLVVDEERVRLLNDQVVVFTYLVDEGAAP
ncbi:MAG: hypothetical protein ACOCX3_02200 [Chloroflexota bacterium]